MSPEYHAPGVYIEEVPSGARPIEGVGTSVAAFVGFTKEGPTNQPTLVTNWTQFVQNFGSFAPGVFLPHAVYGYFNNGGGSCYVVRVGPNGGQPPAEETPAAEGEKPAAPAKGKSKPAYSSATFIGDAARRTGIGSLEAVDEITMLALPDLMNANLSNDDILAVQQAMLDHCAMMKDRVAILDSLPGLNPQKVKTWRVDQAKFDSKYGALYYPWIDVTNPLPASTSSVRIPPCGHIAGIYARSDAERGVHKAPANEIVRGSIGLEQQVSRIEQESLNPEGINCIRAFPGRGIRVWGARTLSTTDKSWKYINVRRLFNFIEESIEEGTQWVVFEPNDIELWGRVKRDITAFLTRVWRDGALFGATAAEAFYVKCDGELNTLEEREAGRLIVEIGLAPVKPAEFVIFRISQWSGGAAVSE